MKRLFLATTLVLLPQVAFSLEQNQRVKPIPSRAIPDYQLGGSYEPPLGVTVVARDSTAMPAEGLYNICYVNGFQTQPDSQWPKEFLVIGKNGKAFADPGWPDEYLLNISSAALREQIAKRLTTSIAHCAEAGFDAVEFDNLDSFSRSKGALTQEDAVAFARLLVEIAHSNGLAAGQKNTPQLSKDERRTIGFDFAVAEECHRFDECSQYTRFYGDQVINIEYTDDLRGKFSAVCRDKNTPKATILRDRMLKAPGQKGYHYAHCPAASR
ncbi:endo alpha-1,4 polygalactosaminidase [Agrobacterium sp. AGB01]|uniref:endo alpha-1,4 polygalactosaminidase n=1 Tax=Agrobacterium sp. AGB01 TaxID=2769302 RepID=UPI00177E41FF|nr:endo alpha-1,4 polygalactosaminidase [Agrobacterium sp. AGB01]MBD9389838.1 endo alpha-1,4 polygalactosaminidase [Agrobacterium sp. AGB01]